MTTHNGQQFRQTYATGATTNLISAHIGTQKMNDDMFARLVAEDVKNRVSDAQREYLHLPQNRERWKRSLLALVSNLEKQIQNISEDRQLDSERYEDLGDDGKILLAEAIQSYDGRQSKIERFKFFVDKRLDYVASLGEDESAVARVAFLEAAILKHKEIIEEEDIEFSDVDEALWAALENKWEFDNINSLG